MRINLPSGFIVEVIAMGDGSYALPVKTVRQLNLKTRKRSQYGRKKAAGLCVEYGCDKVAIDGQTLCELCKAKRRKKYAALRPVCKSCRVNQSIYGRRGLCMKCWDTDFIRKRVSKQTGRTSEVPEERRGQRDGRDEHGAIGGVH